MRQRQILLEVAGHDSEAVDPDLRRSVLFQYVALGPRYRFLGSGPSSWMVFVWSRGLTGVCKS
eukprot:8987198-Pyramimonas_sp.AAC.1